MDTSSRASIRCVWSGRRDLNSRPPAPKAGALPGCATSRCRVRPGADAAAHNSTRRGGTSTLPEVDPAAARQVVLPQEDRPTERNPPAAPIDRKDPDEPIERIDPLDPIDSREPADPTDRMLAALRALPTEATEAVDHADSTEAMLWCDHRERGRSDAFAGHSPRRAAGAASGGPLGGRQPLRRCHVRSVGGSWCTPGAAGGWRRPAPKLYPL